MILLPAIDLLGGKCVRLLKGDYGTARQVAEDPYKALASFVQDGAQAIHIVDLDGAKQGQRVNADLILSLAAACPVPIELGGGIRDIDAVSYYLTHGITRVIIGSAALKRPDFLRVAVETYGDQIAVGIDAKDGYVAAEGWTETSQISFLDFAVQMEHTGVQQIIYTDIGRDGTLSGPNFDDLAALSNRVSVRITASGGIHTLSDIEKLNEMGLYGAIAGRSIYDGTLSLAEAIRVTQREG